jgi:hypothetical protein
MVAFVKHSVSAFTIKKRGEPAEYKASARKGSCLLFKVIFCTPEYLLENAYPGMSLCGERSCSGEAETRRLITKQEPVVVYKSTTSLSRKVRDHESDICFVFRSQDVEFTRFDGDPKE